MRYLAAALILALVPPACTTPTGGQAVEIIAEAPIDVAHARLAKVTIAVRKARESGRLVVGSDAARRVAVDLRAAAAALEAGSVVEANAAMDRIEKEIK